LGDFVINSNILDLFGGSGALTIEGISRGANSGTILEKNSLAVKTIKNNIKNLNIDNIKIIKGNSLAIIKSLGQNEENKRKFNLVFIDPPYKEFFWYQESLNALFKSELISNDSYIICELDSKNNLNSLENFIEIKNKKYGNSRLIFLKPKSDTF